MHLETLKGGTLETRPAEKVRADFDAGHCVLIDVRTPQEFALERIRGALLAPMQSFDPAHLPQDADRPIVLYCGSGKRSRKVAETCLAAGFDRIAHLDGGFGAWKQAGYPYIGTDPDTGGPIDRNS